MTTTFEQANEKLRQAVVQRRDAQAAGRPHEEWYDESQPATEPRHVDASTEESQHVEWDRIADEPYIDDLLEQQRLRGLACHRPLLRDKRLGVHSDQPAARLGSGLHWCWRDDQHCR